MKLLPSWISLPLLVFLYEPLIRIFPKINKDKYVEKVVRAGNSFFHDKFTKIPYQDRILFLPYCLRSKNCPSIIDHKKGLQCDSSCLLDCDIRKLKTTALERGYKDVFIVVSGRLHKNKGILRSRDFLARQIENQKPKAVIGCLCARDLRQKYLSPKNLSPSGTLGSMGHKVLPQIVLLENSNCRKSSVDMEKLMMLIKAKAF